MADGARRTRRAAATRNGQKKRKSEEISDLLTKQEEADTVGELISVAPQDLPQRRMVRFTPANVYLPIVMEDEDVLGEMGQPRKLDFSPVKNDDVAMPLSTKKRKVGKKAAEAVQVFLRVRPSNEAAVRSEDVFVVEDDTNIQAKAPEDSAAFKNGEREGKFQFTKVFTKDAPQDTVFQDSTLPLVDGLFSGQNGLLFAYGITNAGKTYTIKGSEENPGVLPRALAQMFNKIKSLETTKSLAGEPEIWVSNYEIYNEHVYDLLEEIPAKPLPRPLLKLKEDSQGRVYVYNLKEVRIRNLIEAESILKQGQMNRASAETALNNLSSRSHMVFTMKLTLPLITGGNGAENKPIRSKLSIVDLAGSERCGRTQNTGARLKEAANINTSLMTLGRCIEALRWNQQHKLSAPRVVPFRESKITRLFQDYFTGLGSTVMILNVNPRGDDFDETLRAIKYAAIAQEVQTLTSKVDSRRANGKGKLHTSIVEGEDEDADVAEDVDVDVTEAGELELLQEIDYLRKQLVDAELRCVTVEAEVREEVAQEMAERLEQMSDAHRMRLETQLELQEDAMERKVQLYISRTTMETRRGSVSPKVKKAAKAKAIQESVQPSVVMESKEVQVTMQQQPVQSSVDFAKLAEVEKERLSLKQTLKEKEQELQKAKNSSLAQIEELKKQLVESNRERTDCLEKIDLLSQQLLESEDNAAQTQKKLAQSAAEMRSSIVTSEKERQMNQYTKELESLTARNAQLANEVNAEKDKVEIHVKQAQGLKEIVRKLETQIESLNKQIQVLHNKQINSQSEIETLRADNTKLQHELNSLAENNLRNEKIKTRRLEERIEKLEKELNQTRSEKQELADTLEEIQAGMNDMLSTFSETTVSAVAHQGNGKTNMSVPVRSASSTFLPSASSSFKSSDNESVLNMTQSSTAPYASNPNTRGLSRKSSMVSTVSTVSITDVQNLLHSLEESKGVGLTRSKKRVDSERIVEEDEEEPKRKRGKKLLNNIEMVPEEPMETVSTAPAKETKEKAKKGRKNSRRRLTVSVEDAEALEMGATKSKNGSNASDVASDVLSPRSIASNTSKAESIISQAQKDKDTLLKGKNFARTLLSSSPLVKQSSAASLLSTLGKQDEVSDKENSTQSAVRKGRKLFSAKGTDLPQGEIATDTDKVPKMPYTPISARTRTRNR
eukprot:GILK01003258.1.p1 GENE.GILK01003258.1~~GILK01003258.1.p1  ORF type:complete len:1210 (-),score=339.90 GILK01003258.1:490-4023(-)